MCKNFSSFSSSFSFSIFSSFCPVTPGHPCNHGDPPPVTLVIDVVVVAAVAVVLVLFLLLLIIDQWSRFNLADLSRTVCSCFLLTLTDAGTTQIPLKKFRLTWSRFLCGCISIALQSASVFSAQSNQQIGLITVHKSWQLLTLSLISCHRSALLLIALFVFRNKN